jgi:ribosomal protein S18 acetylase RimI-like enzyme
VLDTTALKVVAVRDGVPAGLVRGVVEDGCAWLHSLWVSPQVRGQGLGNQLVAAVEEWAARQGATYIRLEVVPDNAPAIALYRRTGTSTPESSGSSSRTEIASWSWRSHSER